VADAAKFVLRVNSGIFYEAPPTNLWFNALNTDGSPRSFTQSFTPTTTGAPKFPVVFNFLPGAVPVTPSIIAVTPNYKNAYTINSSIQIERQFTKDDSLKVGYVHTAARNMEYLRNMNLINPTGTLADGRPIFAGAINATTSAVSAVQQHHAAGHRRDSDYNALVVHYQHRVSQGFLLQAGYTWSHSISDAPDANSFEQNLSWKIPPTAGATAAIRSRIVRRRSCSARSSSPMSTRQPRFERAGQRKSVEPARQYFLGRSAEHHHQYALNGDTVAVQRPLFIGRNTVRTPNIYQIDARYTRTIFNYPRTYPDQGVGGSDQHFQSQEHHVAQHRGDREFVGCDYVGSDACAGVVGARVADLAIGIRLDF